MKLLLTLLEILVMSVFIVSLARPMVKGLWAGLFKTAHQLRR